MKKSSHLLALAILLAALPPAASARTIEVDRRGGAECATLAQAAALAQPGDTIHVAPGSGPYREILYISHSGEPGKPIVFDGSGETVTGFEPLTFTHQGDRWVCDLTSFFANLKGVQGFDREGEMWICKAAPNAFPSVLIHHGHRVFQDAATGQFPGAILSPDLRVLTLEAGGDPEGWEIAARPFAIRIFNVSHQLYRNVRASGSLNDGVNLHGTGTDLVFEKLEAVQNLDEGFSAHDKIECTLRNSVLRENENGLGNAATSSLTASGLRIHDNSGWGFYFRGCSVDASDVQVWGSGVAQVVLLPAATARFQNVVAYTQPWKTKPWVTSQESKRATGSTVFSPSSQATLDGTVTISPEAAPVEKEAAP